jgi:hypothetical protein
VKGVGHGGFVVFKQNFQVVGGCEAVIPQGARASDLKSLTLNVTMVSVFEWIAAARTCRSFGWFSHFGMMCSNPSIIASGKNPVAA